jgi:hypothetical protein
MRIALGILSLFAFAMLVNAVPSGSAQLDKMTSLERKVSDMEIDAKLMRGDINQLKLDREVDSDSIQGVSDSVDDLRRDLDDGTGKTGKLRADLDELSRRVTDLEDKLRK